jgi:tetratricopeptide (TPR) repeat protein
MHGDVAQLSMAARRAAQARDWATVRLCARKILKDARHRAEGYFLLGLADKAGNRHAAAVRSFSQSVSLDERRYDAAIELADQYVRAHEFALAAAFLQQYEGQLSGSPKYLDMAGALYMRIGLPERAWPLFRKANALQPGIDSLRANLAACSVYVGKIGEAREIYQDLLKKNPAHQRNHYELSRLGRATDTGHIDAMLECLEQGDSRAEKNIYLLYALGKEYEDLENWDESFRYYQMAGDAAASTASYEVDDDVKLIETIIDVCDAAWLARSAPSTGTDISGPMPIFVVGLPRSGTTLSERILSSHSQVDTVDETLFVPLSIRKSSGLDGNELMSPAILRAAAQTNVKRIADFYHEAVAYKTGSERLFVEKFPENFLYLGFIAKAFPQSPIVFLKRNPMDNCFALFKQSFFRYAYTLDDVADYYAAADRLRRHWRRLLGDRLFELEYEQLVCDQESQTRALLDYVGLPFEQACLNFEENSAASNTASNVQIREKIHTRSVNRWQRFAGHLEPLRRRLEKNSIEIA